MAKREREAEEGEDEEDSWAADPLFLAAEAAVDPLLLAAEAYSHRAAVAVAGSISRINELVQVPTVQQQLEEATLAEFRFVRLLGGELAQRRIMMEAHSIMMEAHSAASAALASAAAAAAPPASSAASPLQRWLAPVTKASFVARASAASQLASSAASPLQHRLALVTKASVVARASAASAVASASASTAAAAAAPAAASAEAAAAQAAAATPAPPPRPATLRRPQERLEDMPWPRRASWMGARPKSQAPRVTHANSAPLRPVPKRWIFDTVP